MVAAVRETINGAYGTAENIAEVGLDPTPASIRCNIYSTLQAAFTGVDTLVQHVLHEML